MENRIMNEAMGNTGNTEIAGFAKDIPMAMAMENECLGLEYSFDRIKLPTGNGMKLILPPKENGEPNEVSEINGVILYNHPQNAYYSNRYVDENNPPDCTSWDGTNGIGYPGGDCRVCPYNKFGSGRGRSKLCKNRRMLYILQEGDIFPVMLSLPTGSLKPFADYVKKQIIQGRKISEIVTVIKIRSKFNLQGEAYPALEFAFHRGLAPEEQKVVSRAADIAKAYVEKHVLLNVSIDPETGEIMEPMR